LGAAGSLPDPAFRHQIMTAGLIVVKIREGILAPYASKKDYT
jgi:phosphotransferase system IIA component